jgi:hypothetical protein
MTASYSGSADYTASTSNELNQYIQPTATSTALVSSLSTSSYGEAVTLTATVTAAYGTPTGTVTFFSNGTSIGTGALSNGVATITTSTLAVGTDSLTATSKVNAGYSNSTSAAVSQVVD